MKPSRGSVEAPKVVPILTPHPVDGLELDIFLELKSVLIQSQKKPHKFVFEDIYIQLQNL